MQDISVSDKKCFCVPFVIKIIMICNYRKIFDAHNLTLVRYFQGDWIYHVAVMVLVAENQISFRKIRQISFVAYAAYIFKLCISLNDERGVAIKLIFQAHAFTEEAAFCSAFAVGHSFSPKKEKCENPTLNLV
jgi:hypothetical protein